MRRLMVLGILALAAGGGCGGDETSDDGARSGASPRGAEQEGGGERGRERERRSQPSARERGPRPSARDEEAQQQLRRHLREEAAVASGWKFADVASVQVRGTRVAVETRLTPARREAATSLCLAARRFFLTGDQGQSPFDVAVVRAEGSPLARC